MAMRRISPDHEVVVVNTRPGACRNGLIRLLSVAARRFLAPGEQADIEQLNEECPRSEWSEDSEWQAARPVATPERRLHDRSADHAEIHVSTTTVGGNICIGELKDAVRMMRQFRGPGVYPVVSPAAKHMNTRFGGRQRPHFVIKRWISFGPDGTAALPSASPHSLQAPASASQQGPDRKAAADQHGKTQDKRSGAERRSCRRGAHAPRRAERRYP